VSSHLNNRNVHVALTHDPILIQPYRELIADLDVGAHAWFEGVTRRLTGARETTRLKYEAFEPMAIAQLTKIGEETLQEFTLARLVIIHRLGEVPVGEVSLLVGCSAPHRASVFLAMPKIVDRLKQEVPIWKQEHFADGTTDWVHPS
jgi:molybdopterin synthase catalytic subunit